MYVDLTKYANDSILATRHVNFFFPDLLLNVHINISVNISVQQPVGILAQCNQLLNMRLGEMGCCTKY